MQPDSLGHFEPHTSTTFEVQLEGGGTYQLTLASSGTLPSRTIEGLRADPFHLIFTGSEIGALPQDAHTLTHATLGEFTLFLVPVGAKDGEVEYQAVFN